MKTYEPKFQQTKEPHKKRPTADPMASRPLETNPSLTQHSNQTGLPDRLKTGIESLSGYAMDDVRVHYNSNKPAQLQAHAYTQGTDIHVASGQAKYLPHEAWHVVQQAQGRVKPTKQLEQGASINDNQNLEREADVMGSKASTDTANRQTPIIQPVQTSLRPTSSPVVQRIIAISPTAYVRGLNALPNTITNSQLNEYFMIAVADEYKFALKILPKGEERDNLKELVKSMSKKGISQATKINHLNTLVNNINEAIQEHYQVYEDNYTANGQAETIPIPNRRTRYATTPEKGAGYAHTDINAAKNRESKWGTDPDMRSQFAEGVSDDIKDDNFATTAARGREMLPLKQLPWAKAKQLLPKPLLNLIFDVRFQLETNSVIDERTPEEQRRREKSPIAPGTLRSWHQDSEGALPANNFDEQAIPQHARNLDNHYTTASQTGAGASIGDGVSRPQGFAEYTGTGTNSAHNIKIVLDYINKRVYLTLTHYQYWALIKKSGKYTFWESDTQELAQAQGRLNDVKNTDIKILMSPWMEILMPT